MITHVAAAGEGRGRVLLWLSSSAPTSSSAIEAAMVLARAYQSEVESLYIEDSQLFDLAQYPFARAIGSDDAAWQDIAQPELEREIRFAGAALQRQVLGAAKRATVPCQTRVVRDEPLRAIAEACSQNGPWNVVALAEPFGAEAERRLEAIFLNVPDMTGVVVAGRDGRRVEGPVIAIVEQIERLSSMQKAAERIASVTGGTVKLMLVGDRPGELARIEGEARLLLSESMLADALVADVCDVALETVLTVSDDVAPLADALRRQRCGFVVAQHAGEIVGNSAGLRALTSALDCPLLLVR